jgi:hypothetical protein
LARKISWLGKFGILTEKRIITVDNTAGTMTLNVDPKQNVFTVVGLPHAPSRKKRKKSSESALVVETILYLNDLSCDPSLSNATLAINIYVPSAGDWNFPVSGLREALLNH